MGNVPVVAVAQTGKVHLNSVGESIVRHVVSSSPRSFDCTLRSGDHAMLSRLLIDIVVPRLLLHRLA